MRLRGAPSLPDDNLASSRARRSTAFSGSFTEPVRPTQDVFSFMQRAHVTTAADAHVRPRAASLPVAAPRPPPHAQEGAATQRRRVLLQRGAWRRQRRPRKVQASLPSGRAPPAAGPGRPARGGGGGGGARRYALRDRHSKSKYRYMQPPPLIAESPVIAGVAECCAAGLSRRWWRTATRSVC